ncbi:monosaccharide ABC transporter ATP-binding protein, CUT2 family [Actinomyces ruminicola]|uniref:Monosaccharide ABC transporter ATP-binding protein, CUT2 family n=1 Tax=Actinomyces ruminicola TaxID=332524 RepID=A0A1G9ZY44_9ACTO|nr:sugar ABC transporter ATP-binding protein [Actinomyces ruminicola]SDN26512.1 monosaccharide ABC transporter ATP-binding protein, CUT2 family [Actinomyces ruminicola]
MAPPRPPRLRLIDVSKSFPGVQALSGVSFDLLPGEVHALVGENGAGKSTLVKILTGIHPDFEGTYEYDGAPAAFHSIRDAQQAGIAIVHQELNMMADLTVAQNIFIGRESSSLLISDRALNRRARDLLAEHEVDVDPRTLLRDLSVSKAQLVEIVRALSFESTRVLILDEPTAALSEAESAELLQRVKRLRDRGVAIVYISHRMHEVMAVADRITVLRDGTHVGTLTAAETNLDQIIEMMVGRQVVNTPKTRSEVAPDAPVVMRAEHLASGDVKDVSFTLHRGEILGFAGLVGAGRTETMRIIAGADRPTSGRLEVNGTEVSFRRPKDAIRAGIAYLSEDRKRFGLVTGLSVSDNTVLASYDAFTTATVVHERAVQRATRKYVDMLRIKTPSTRQRVRNLSGGNQQKVVLAKWLLRDVDVLIFDEPTRGIDIGARAEIYQLMRDLVAQGKSIILVSSDLDEVLHLSDRVVVMREGRKTGELDASEATQIKIMELATKQEAGRAA